MARRKKKPPKGGFSKTDSKNSGRKNGPPGK
jgi:hypothetical protein